MNRVPLPGLIGIVLAVLPILAMCPTATLADNPLAGNDDYLYPASMAVVDGLAALRSNPAGLAMRPGEWGLHFYQGLRDPGGKERGLSLGSDWSLTLGGRLALGFDWDRAISGYEYDFDGQPITPIMRRYSRLSLGCAQRYDIASWRSQLAFGAAWRRSFSSAYTLDGLSSWDIGVQFRWRDSLAFGFAGRAVDEPKFKGLFPGDRRVLDPEHSWSFAFRPPWRWLTVSFDLHNFKVDGRWDRSSSYAVEAELLERLDLRLAFDSEERVSLGLAFSLGRWRAQGHLGETSRSDGERLGAVTLEWRNHLFGQPLRGNRRVLRLDLSGDIPEISPEGASEAGEVLGLCDILDAIRQAEHSRDIGGILLVLGSPRLNLAQCEEIRGALLGYRASSGKPVIFYSERYDLHEYYLASAGSHITLNPLGALRLSGVQKPRPYLADALARLGVTAQFISHEKCSPTWAQLSTNAPSACAATADTGLLSTRHAMLRQEIAASRGLDQVSLAPLISREHFSPEEALEGGLIDEIVFVNQLPNFLLRQRVNTRAISPDDLLSRTYRKRHWGVDSQVALVHLSGVLTRAEAGPRELGGSYSAATLASLMREIRANSHVKGLILRVDSSGGDALASEVIRHELRLTGLQMPIVVSVGNRALGGGYLAALAGDRILAGRFSHLGGINALGGKFVFGRRAGRLGLHLHEQADGQSLYDENQLAGLGRRVAQHYDRFTEAVSGSRHIGAAELTYVGQSRILLGDESREYRLIDEIGGLDDALRAMRELLALPDESRLELLRYPLPPGWREKLVERLRGGLSPAVAERGRAGEDGIIRRLLDLQGEQMYYYETLPGEGLDLLHIDGEGTEP